MSIDVDKACEIIHKQCEKEWNDRQSPHLHPSTAHRDTMTVYAKAVDDNPHVGASEQQLVAAILRLGRVDGIWHHPKPGDVMKMLGA